MNDILLVNWLDVLNIKSLILLNKLLEVFEELLKRLFEANDILLVNWLDVLNVKSLISLIFLNRLLEVFDE